MPRQSDAAKIAIKGAVDIVKLVSDYGLSLHRAGSRYKAACPWHDDRHPSLEVNPERQTFKCWVCNIGGDVFEFVQKMDRVDFPEALRTLAERAGVSLDDMGPARRVDGPSRTELGAVLAWAEGLFETALARDLATREYLEGRGLTAETASRFRVGYAPDEPGWLFEEARRKGELRALSGPTPGGAEPPTPPIASAAELLRAMDPIDREFAGVAVGCPDLVASLVVRVPLSLIRDDLSRMILDAAYEIYGRGEVPAFDAIKDDLEDPRARAVVEYLNSLQDGLEHPELQPLDVVQFPIGTWEERLELVLAQFAERERLTRLDDLKQAMDETDRHAEPDAYRALQLEYRRLLTQRAGTSNKQNARPDPTYRA